MQQDGPVSWNGLNRLHDLTVSLDPEEVWRCLGPAGRARDRLQDEVVKAADVAGAVSVPRAISRALPVTSARRGKVLFDGGVEAAGKRLPHIFEGAEGALFVVATAGPGVEARVNELFAEDDPVAGIVLDAGGTAVALNACEQTVAQLSWELQELGYRVGPAIAPGTEPWDIEGQRTVFEAAPVGDIGVMLLESLLMSPQKSQSRMVPFGRDLHLVNDPNAAPCRTCRAKRCPMRIEEYAGPLGT